MVITAQTYPFYIGLYVKISQGGNPIFRLEGIHSLGIFTACFIGAM